jgi:hypothetical protein
VYLILVCAEIIRKTFHKWLNAARNSHHLRMTLEAKEQEMRLARMTAAWDKWRDRYKDERLRVTVSNIASQARTTPNQNEQEKEVILQTQRNLVFRSFGIWLSKTQVDTLDNKCEYISHLRDSPCRPFASQPRIRRSKLGEDGERRCRRHSRRK